MTPRGTHVSDDVRQVEDLHAPIADTDESATIADLLDRQARALHDAHSRGDSRCRVQLGNWLPRLTGASAEAILAAPLTLDDAREAIAREHGFKDWSTVQANGAVQPDPQFEQAVEAVVQGDLETLRSLLAANSELARARSNFGHRATLLNYLAANGVETRRQKSPYEAAAIARLLIDSGADVRARARVYGGEFDTLALLETSAHPTEAGTRDALADLLKQASTP